MTRRTVNYFLPVQRSAQVTDQTTPASGNIRLIAALFWDGFTKEPLVDRIEIPCRPEITKRSPNANIQTIRAQHDIRIITWALSGYFTFPLSPNKPNEFSNNVGHDGPSNRYLSTHYFRSKCHDLSIICLSVHNNYMCSIFDQQVAGGERVTFLPAAIFTIKNCRSNLRMNE